MTRPTVAEISAVAVGGVIGTGLRWGLDTLVPHTPVQFPLSTLITNILGTLVLAYLVSEVWTRNVPSWVKAGVGPGILGTYTTFSALVLALVTLTAAHEAVLAGIYFIVSAFGGLAAALGGIALGNWRRAARAPEGME
jgi:CrcB protein